MTISSVVCESTAAEPTAQQLILAALRLFAQRGVDGVSIRSITSAAGASNQSAVHYHFTSKTGLVRAVVDLVNQYLAPLQREALLELQALAQAKQPTVQEIMCTGLSPYVYLLEQPNGPLALRFLARLTWETGSEGQDLLLEKIRPYFLKLMPYLQKALPSKPVEAIDFHLYMVASNVIHGLADITLMVRQSRSDVDRLYRERPAEMLRLFYDYVSAGIASGTALDHDRGADDKS